MRIQFLRDEQFECDGRHQGPVFITGGQYDVTEAFGQRWIQRGVAFVVDADVHVDVDTYEIVGRGEAPTEAAAPDDRRAVIAELKAGQVKFNPAQKTDKLVALLADHRAKA